MQNSQKCFKPQVVLTTTKQAFQNKKQKGKKPFQICNYALNDSNDKIQVKIVFWKPLQELQIYQSL